MTPDIRGAIQDLRELCPQYQEGAAAVLRVAEYSQALPDLRFLLARTLGAIKEKQESNESLRLQIQSLAAIVQASERMARQLKQIEALLFEKNLDKGVK
jgi:hypothetical protein